MWPFLIPFVFVLTIAALVIWQIRLFFRREAFIRTFVLPKGLYDKLRAKHPALSLKECQLVAQGLRQFFLTHLKSGRKHVSMPSQVVDDLWHEFILYTRNYQQFCDQAFGRFFHHTPAAVMGAAGGQNNAGLRRCWWHACREENIDPRTPARLPLLFALDTKLNIPNGFRYAPDCAAARLAATAAGVTSVGIIYCGGDFSSSSIDGSTDGFGDSGGSDGGSDGGGGCGGGGD